MFRALSVSTPTFRVRCPVARLKYPIKRKEVMMTVVQNIATSATTFEYDRWRHGGWYWFAGGVRWPEGGCGCVSRQMLNPATGRADRKWRIVCDPRGTDHTYASRDAAARAEYNLMIEAHLRQKSA